jgi:hypothetical protein
VLLKNKIFAAGSIRVNGFANPPFLSNKTLAKMGRGSCYELISNHNIGLIKWFDNKAVHLGSNFILSGTSVMVDRFDKKKIKLPCPLNSLKLFTSTIKACLAWTNMIKW